MNTVFIGGSRRIPRLDRAVRDRVQNIVDQDLPVVIGDANGADRAVQRFLADLHYRNVSVYCSGTACRNNLGEWHTRHVLSEGAGFWFYAAKDIAMSEAADYGLMIWDGESVGTIHNVLNLLDREKPVVVYFAPEGLFVNLRVSSDLDALIERCPKDAVQNFERRLGLAARMQSLQSGLNLAR
jgi:hypothetical protein